MLWWFCNSNPNINIVIIRFATAFHFKPNILQSIRWKRFFFFFYVANKTKYNYFITATNRNVAIFTGRNPVDNYYVKVYQIEMRQSLQDCMSEVIKQTYNYTTKQHLKILWYYFYSCVKINKSNRDTNVPTCITKRW